MAAKWLVVARVYIDTETQNIAAGGVIHPEWVYEGRVLDWGYIDRSIPTPCGGLPEVSDAKVRIADTDRKWRDLLAYQTPRRRRVEIKLIQAGSSEAATGTIFTGEIIDAEFGPGWVELTIHDNTGAWLDEEIPGFINRTNYPDLAPGIDEAFFPYVFGENRSRPENPQGVIPLPHIGFITGVGDRWGASCLPLWDVVAVYRKLPGEGAFSVVDPSEFNVTTEDRNFFEIPNFVFQPVYIDFLVEQDPGTEIRADIDGVHIRGAWGNLPTIDHPGAGALRNPVDVLICMAFLALRKLGMTGTTEEACETDEWEAVRTLFFGTSDMPPIYYDGALVKKMTNREYLANWLTCFQCDMPILKNGKWGLRFVQDTDPARPLFTDRRYILRDSFYETIARPTVNRVNLFYELNFATDEFASIEAVNNEDDQINLGLPERDSAGDIILDSLGEPVRTPKIEEEDLRFLWIRDQVTALFMAARYLSWVALGSYRQRFQLPLVEVINNIELADLIGITHWLGLDVGGYVNKEVIPRRMTIRLSELILDVYTILRVPQELALPVTVDAEGEAFSGTGELMVEQPGIDLVLTFELLDRPRQSSTTEKIFYDSLIYMDTSWFDGTVSYFLEAECSNGGATSALIKLAAHNPTDHLVNNNTDNGGIMHSITVPAGTTRQLIRSTEWNPLGIGEYKMILGATPTSHALKVYAFRIVIKIQSGSRARGQLPMGFVGAITSQDAFGWGDSRFNDTEYLVNSSSWLYRPSFSTLYTDSVFLGVEPRPVGSVTKLGNRPDYPTYVAAAVMGRKDAGPADTLVGPEMRTHINASVSEVYMFERTGGGLLNFRDTSDQYEEGEEYAVFTGCYENFNNIILSRHDLFFGYDQIRTFSSYHRVHHAAGRQYVDPAEYSNPEFYLEACGSRPVGSLKKVQLFTFASASATAGTAVPGALIDFGADTKTNVRVGPFTLSGGPQWLWTQVVGPSGGITVNDAFLVIRCTRD